MFLTPVVADTYSPVCRFLTGCGAGIGLCTGPVFLAEVAPSNIRGSVGGHLCLRQHTQAYAAIYTQAFLLSSPSSLAS
jgi:hypothetical protein